MGGCVPLPGPGSSSPPPSSGTVVDVVDDAGSVVEVLEATIEALRIAMFCVGAPGIEALRNTPHLRRCEDEPRVLYGSVPPPDRA